MTVDGSLTVTDTFSTSLASANVQITGNYVSAEDALAFDNANPWGITGTWTAATGTLALSGNSSVANYQAALRSVTYQNTSEKPTTSPRTISVTASDGIQGSTPVTRQINVTSVNDPPASTVPAAQVIDEDTALVFSASNANQIILSDADAGSNAIQVTLSAANGKATLAQTTGLTFITGTGVANQTMTFTGTLSAINAALNGLRFDPTANFNGGANLQILTNDLGNSGSGGGHSLSRATPLSRSIRSMMRQ
jgi:hypothetical protein